MRYLITGGAGFIGSALAQRLSDDDHEIRVLDDMSRGRASRLKDTSAEIMHGDVRDKHTVIDATRGVDTVVHLAYMQGTQTFYARPRDVLDVAVLGIRNVLDACEQLDVRNLMLVSSSEAYQVADPVPTPESVHLRVPDPLNTRYSYGCGKIYSEVLANAYLREGALTRLAIVRPHNIYGPDMGNEHVIPQTISRLKEQVAKYPAGSVPFRIQGTGAETRSFCYITDCVDQLALVLDRLPAFTSPHIFNVGTQDERTIKAVVMMIGRHFGRDLNFTFTRAPEGSPSRRLPDMAQLAKFGYQPKVAFANGLARTVAWYRND